jgi:hypothetical protein
MINAVADFTGSDHLLCQRDCRHAAIIETNHVRNARPFHRVHHPTSLGRVSRQRLFTNDCFP